MNSPQAVANLEVLLVELQYAVADLAYEKAPMTDALQSGDWDARLLKLMAACRASRSLSPVPGKKLISAIVLKIIRSAVVRSGPLTRGSQHAIITR